MRRGIAAAVALESERLPDGAWARTMHVSADGGRTWRVLWRDELRRAR